LTRQATIYVVDDDDAVSDSLRMLLEAEGFTVFAFACAEAFLAVARAEDPACLLLDLNMPGTGGFELLARIRRESGGIPVVLMTGRFSAAAARAAASAGAALLEKPFQGGELLDAIERALGGGAKG
jgi:two-component system response regulator FixJ